MTKEKLLEFKNFMEINQIEILCFKYGTKLSIFDTRHTKDNIKITNYLFEHPESRTCIYLYDWEKFCEEVYNFYDNNIYKL